MLPFSTGCGSAWLERSVRDAEAARSNRAIPTRKIKGLQITSVAPFFYRTQGGSLRTHAGPTYIIVAACNWCTMLTLMPSSCIVPQQLLLHSLIAPASPGLSILWLLVTRGFIAQSFKMDFLVPQKNHLRPLRFIFYFVKAELIVLLRAACEQGVAARLCYG